MSYENLMSKFTSISDGKLRESVKNMSLDELKYILNRYCGPHNMLLRIKKFNSLSSSELSRIIHDEIASREIDAMLSTDNTN